VHPQWAGPRQLRWHWGLHCEDGVSGLGPLSSACSAVARRAGGSGDPPGGQRRRKSMKLKILGTALETIQALRPVMLRIRRK
jgi:hypothetical protein